MLLLNGYRHLIIAIELRFSYCAIPIVIVIDTKGVTPCPDSDSSQGVVDMTRWWINNGECRQNLP
jgi:hypothetical protein